MRGSDTRSGELFSYVDLEVRVPVHHPLRRIRALVNDVLVSLNDEFARLYSPFGRESIPPERLLRALLLQAFFSIRSERQLMEQLDYNLLFRWFVGLGIDDAVGVPTVFSKNRDRLLDADVAAKFMIELLAHKDVRSLLSDDHFSVDGTLIEAWASMKSFQPKSPPPEPGTPDHDTLSAGQPEICASRTDRSEPFEKSEGPKTASPKPPSEPRGVAVKERNAEVNFHGQKRSNATHASTTDPGLYKKGKGKEAKLCFMGHALMENRNGLIVAAELTHADGYGEREAALAMIERRCPGERQLTLGADKGYDTYVDKFDTTRWLVAGRLTGSWDYQASDRSTWHFTPKAELVYFSETSADYIDSRGVDISGQRVGLGRFKVGPETSYRHTTAAGTRIEPRIAVQGL